LGITIGSGASFASPSVAGVASVLCQKHPGATARQIRNAIIMSANFSLLSDGSTVLDQGRGYVNAAAASAFLTSGAVPDTVAIPSSFGKSVKVNVEKNTFLNVRDGLVTEPVSGLNPGQRADILYRVHSNTRQVIVSLSGVTPALPPAQQNQLFGDDVLLAVHTAKTSGIDDYPVFAFTTGGTFAVNNPEPGILRVTVNGDWTNAGQISADVTVFSVTDPLPQFTSEGKIEQFQTLAFPVNIPTGISKAEFRLGWREDWGNYPTADLDLILVNPASVVNVAGATASSPEFVQVNNPAAGTWLVLVDGFEIHTGTDKFELRVSLDGKVVK
ncbi:MAG: S8 family serine peptidase, partial [Acidobacteria bacterium]|nr:S8 family serine peptidase [Acidobacteriota bacterium]